MGRNTSCTLQMPDGNVVLLPLSALVLKNLTSQQGAKRIAKALNLLVKQEREARELARIAMQPARPWREVRDEIESSN